MSAPGAPTVHIEREVKMAAWAGMTLPDLNGVIPGTAAVALPSQRLSATYYDTADLRLARWGVTLRHRAAETERGKDTSELPWTLKLPSPESGQGLTRQELSFAGPEGKVPAALVQLVRAFARSAPLVPVARLRTDRLRLEVVGADGLPLVEVDDDEVSVLVPGPSGRGRRLAARFREIEVELSRGADASALAAVVARLRAAGTGLPDPTPKLVRALGPRALEPPDVGGVTPGRRATVGDAVRAAIGNSVARLIRHDPGVRLGDDAEDVHQARVATRRLRSDLRTFGSLLDEAWANGLRAELGWIAALLGGVRDTDVLLERLRTNLAALPMADAKAGHVLVRRLEDQREQARVAVLEGMDSPRYLTLLDSLVDAAHNPVFVGGHDVFEPAPVEAGPAADVLPALVRRPWRHLARAVAELGPEPADEALHEVRIRAKRCRYAAEAAAPVIGRPAAKLAAAVAEVQGVLGDFHDAIVAEEWLRAAAARGPATLALAAGQLVAAERREAAANRAQWEAEWKKASSKRLRAWMTTGAPPPPVVATSNGSAPLAMPPVPAAIASVAAPPTAVAAPPPAALAPPPPPAALAPPAVAPIQTSPAALAPPAVAPIQTSPPKAATPQAAPPPAPRRRTPRRPPPPAAAPTAPAPDPAPPPA